MQPAGPTQLIAQASRSARAALRQWKATDLESVHHSRSLLQQAAADLKTAIDLLRAGVSDMTSDFQPSIVSLRRDISTMVRLVDACAAFHRGLSPRAAGIAPAYDASGQTVGEHDSVPAQGVLG